MPAPLMLTPREAQIAKLIVDGLSNKDIARYLNIALTTAKTHVHHILVKLNLQRRNQVKISFPAPESFLLKNEDGVTRSPVRRQRL